MRFLGIAVITSAAIALGACGGGDKPKADSTAAATPAATPATAAPVAAGAMSPITGQTHEIKMIGDGKGYRFEPAELTIKVGDGVKFVVEGVGPHNIMFNTVPEAAKAQLSANMPEQSGELSSKMLMAAGETYTVSFGGVPAGVYEFNCTPHLAMNMKGKITVQ